MLLERMGSDGKGNLRQYTESISEAYLGPNLKRQAFPKQPEIIERQPSSAPDPLSREWIFEPWPLLTMVSPGYQTLTNLATFFLTDMKVRFLIPRPQSTANEHTLVRYSPRAAIARRSVVIHVASFFAEKAHK